MGKFILKRVLQMIPTIFIVLTIVFLLLRVVPGSPAHSILKDRGEEVTKESVYELEEELGLHDPLIVQYLRFVKDVFTGNWGTSYVNNKPCFQNILDCMEPTIMMGALYFVLHLVTCLPIGVYCAIRRNTVGDYAVTIFSMLFAAIPGFCLALLFIFIFSIKLDIFPAVGYVTIAEGGFFKALYYVALPAIVASLQGIAGAARLTRSKMLDVLNQDYIRTARAKGLPPSKIYFKHAFKNTLSVTANIIVSSFVGIVGGSSIMEQIFNQHGMGRLALTSLQQRDYPQEQAIVLFTVFLSLLTKLINDIIYKLIDPRIEYE